MCQAFSCIVAKTGKVYWEVGMDSHDELIEKFKLRHRDDTTDPQEMRICRVEITPDKGYLYPEKHWTLKIDESIKPIWWHEGLEKKSFAELENWKAEVYQFNFEEARHPINPLKKIQKPTELDIENLKKWASVRASVRASVGDSVRASVWASVGDSVGDSVWASVWASVGDSVWASVWASVGAYVGSLFPAIWKDIYPFQPAVDLWKRGFVPSFDGKTWRLHSGRKAKIVYEWIKREA